jgi:hypothetical protein
VVLVAKVVLQEILEIQETLALQVAAVVVVVDLDQHILFQTKHLVLMVNQEILEQQVAVLQMAMVVQVDHVELNLFLREVVLQEMQVLLDQQVIQETMAQAQMLVMQVKKVR